MQLLAVCNQMCCNEVTYHETYVGNKRTLFRIFFIDDYFLKWKTVVKKLQIFNCFSLNLHENHFIKKFQQTTTVQ